jgi:hypothetical protein
LHSVSLVARHRRLTSLRTKIHSARLSCRAFQAGAERQSYVHRIANLETNSAFYADILPLPFVMRIGRTRNSVKRWIRKSSAALGEPAV